jgi:hypothetical protein
MSTLQAAEEIRETCFLYEFSTFHIVNDIKNSLSLPPEEVYQIGTFKNIQDTKNKVDKQRDEVARQRDEDDMELMWLGGTTSSKQHKDSYLTHEHMKEEMKIIKKYKTRPAISESEGWIGKLPKTSTQPIIKPIIKPTINPNILPNTIPRKKQSSYGELKVELEPESHKYTITDTRTNLKYSKHIISGSGFFAYAKFLKNNPTALEYTKKDFAYDRLDKNKVNQLIRGLEDQFDVLVDYKNNDENLDEHYNIKTIPHYDCLNGLVIEAIERFVLDDEIVNTSQSVIDDLCDLVLFHIHQIDKYEEPYNLHETILQETKIVSALVRNAAIPSIFKTFFKNIDLNFKPIDIPVFERYASRAGTDFHAYMEKKIKQRRRLEGDVIENVPLLREIEDYKQGIAFLQDYQHIEFALIEHRMASIPHLMCGSADIISVKRTNGRLIFKIWDFKRTKKLKEVKAQSHTFSCKWLEWSIQASVYWCLLDMEMTSKKLDYEIERVAVIVVPHPLQENYECIDLNLDESLEESNCDIYMKKLLSSSDITLPRITPLLFVQKMLEIRRQLIENLQEDLHDE